MEPSPAPHLGGVRLRASEALREMHVGTRDGGLTGHHAHTTLILPSLLGLGGEVVETTHPAHQLHPGVHLFLALSGQIVYSPRGLDIKHKLEPNLPTIKRQTRVDLEI